MPSQLTSMNVEIAFAELGIEFSDSGLTELFTNTKYQYARTTSSSRYMMKGGMGYLSEYLYHCYLTDQKKCDIFISRFEIGHPEKVEGTYTELSAYLQDKYGGEDAYDHIKESKKFIQELTNIPFDDFYKRDSSLALKVLALFYRFSRQYRSKLFSFLRAEDKGKANYEYRSIRPMPLDQSIDNTALLADLLAHLTYSMPSAYAQQARTIHQDIATARNEMEVYIKSEFDAEKITISHGITGKYSIEMIEPAIHDLLHYEGETPIYDRLDFKLYATLSLIEYSVRRKSNLIVSSIVYSNKFELKSLCRARLPSFSDKDVLTFLFDQPIVLPSKLEQKAAFLEKIYEHYSKKPIRVGVMNKQIMKAIILHDEKLGIKIPSIVQGTNNIPQSVTSILKEAIRISEENNGEFPDPSIFPEALTYYWFLRYRLALDVLMAEDKNIKHTKLAEMFRLNLLVDEKLVAYLKNKNISGFQSLKNLPDKFACKLGYAVPSVVTFIE
jgi:hypothetical protein